MIDRIVVEHKYCCKKFYTYNKNDETIYKIFSLNKEEQGWWIQRRNDRGYNDGIIAMKIEYCPFCGKELK